MKVKHRQQLRERRHRRVRQKVVGTPERPRLCVYKSLKHLHAQVIDDVAGRTLCSASTLEKALKLKGGTVQSAQALGKVIAERALSNGIRAVVFDRSGYAYHGVVKAFAEASRKAGLQF
jgi:large subunit ribosomal protein L18